MYEIHFVFVKQRFRALRKNAICANIYVANRQGSKKTERPKWPKRPNAQGELLERIVNLTATTTFEIQFRGKLDSQSVFEYNLNVCDSRNYFQCEHITSEIILEILTK